MIDDNLIDELFEKLECGFKKKFKKKFEEWRNSVVGEENDNTKVVQQKVTNNENFSAESNNSQSSNQVQISLSNSISFDASGLSEELDFNNDLISYMRRFFGIHFYFYFKGT